MRKFLLSVSLLTLSVCGFIGCSQQREWSREQRQALRQMLRDYRQMVYLENLTEAEYMLFADEVAAEIEQDYPIYTSFIELPAVNDTVQVYVVTTIVEQLNADARNMRHLFPYNSLVENSVLPSGLDRAQQYAFYRCLARKVNNTYPTVGSFVDAMLADTTAVNTISQLQQQCAADLFGWQVDIVEIVESN
ncbi:MAG: hypothetical protein IJX65_00600 [Alistipes sp.]|nr:hypothetical protein [Alistipes sp.]